MAWKPIHLSKMFHVNWRRRRWCEGGEGYVLGTGPPVQVGHDVVPVSKLWLLRLPVVLNILAEGVDEAEELSSHWGKLDKRGQLLIGAVGRQVTWGKDSFGAIFIWISSAISFDFSGN